MKGSVYGRHLLVRAGLEVAVVRGPTNVFLPESGIVMLDHGAYDGGTVEAWTVAAHEVAHAVQAKQWGRWAIGLRALLPGRLWLEWDANRRARRMMAASGLVADEGVLRASWESYSWPAVRQVLVVGAVLIGALVGGVSCRMRAQGSTPSPRSTTISDSALGHRSRRSRILPCTEMRLRRDGLIDAPAFTRRARYASYLAPLD